MSSRATGSEQAPGSPPAPYTLSSLQIVSLLRISGAFGLYEVAKEILSCLARPAKHGANVDLIAELAKEVTYCGFTDSRGRRNHGNYNLQRRLFTGGSRGAFCGVNRGWIEAAFTHIATPPSSPISPVSPFHSSRSSRTSRFASSPSAPSLRPHPFRRSFPPPAQHLEQSLAEAQLRLAQAEALLRAQGVVPPWGGGSGEAEEGVEHVKKEESAGGKSGKGNEAVLQDTRGERDEELAQEAGDDDGGCGGAGGAGSGGGGGGDDLQSGGMRGKGGRKVRGNALENFRTRHVALQIMYLGSRYLGFASQGVVGPTVEGRLVSALLHTRLLIPAAASPASPQPPSSATEPAASATIMNNSREMDWDVTVARGNCTAREQGGKDVTVPNGGMDAKLQRKQKRAARQRGLEGAFTECDHNEGGGAGAKGGVTILKDIMKDGAAGYSRCGRTDRGVNAIGQVVALHLRSSVRPRQQHAGMTVADVNLEVADCATAAATPADPTASQSNVTTGSVAADLSAVDVARRSDDVARESADVAGEIDYVASLNRALPDDIRVLAWAPAPPDFSASPSNTSNSPQHPSVWVLQVVGTAFLWHQIRCMMAVLLMVGRGQEQPEVVSELLAVHGGPFTSKPQYAPADPHGLWGQGQQATPCLSVPVQTPVLLIHQPAAQCSTHPMLLPPLSIPPPAYLTLLLPPSTCPLFSGPSLAPLPHQTPSACSARPSASSSMQRSSDDPCPFSHSSTCFFPLLRPPPFPSLPDAKRLFCQSIRQQLNLALIRCSVLQSALDVAESSACGTADASLGVGSAEDGSGKAEKHKQLPHIPLHRRPRERE
ncbi:unnamed protein product [Closterium sp. Yama58-4]|nr:unnamed protein product [Closterium sp. Yama58-4]